MSEKNVSDAPKRRPGPEGNFRGLRLEYLTSHLSTYQKAVKDKTTRDFWQPVFSGYWKRIEWRKSLEEETDSDLFQSASVITNEILSEGDSALKSAAIAKTNQQIKSWFQNRKYSNKPVTSNPYTLWLEQFRKPGGPPPKKPSLAQFYLQHQDYADKVNERFKARCLVEHTPRSHLLSLRCEVAKELFAEETQEVQAKVKEELDIAHASLFAKYQEDMTGEPSTDPADQKIARDLLAEVVQPFIDGIHKYTGLTVCLLGGAPPQTPTDKFELFTLHAGKTVGDDPKNWTDWDRPAFKKQILNPFMKFLRHTVDNCPSGSAGVDEEEPNVFISSGVGSTVPAAAMRISANASSANDSVSFSVVPSTTIATATTASSDPNNQERSLSSPSTPLPAMRPPSISSPIPSMSPLKLREHLRRHINGLAPQRQKAEIARLTKLSEYERTRENNILQNKELLQELGIDGLDVVLNKAGRNNGLPRGKKSGAASKASAREKDAEDFEPDDSEDGSSEHAGRPRRSTRLSAAQPVAMDESTEVSVGSTSGPNDVLANHDVAATVDQSGSSNRGELQEDEEPNGGPTDHNATAINSGSLNMGKSKDDEEEGIDDSVGTDANVVNLTLAPAVEVDRTEWPAWVETWYKIFMDKNFGPLWVEVVGNWTAIERGYDWESPKNAALTTKCRPGAVPYWVQRGRPVEPERYPDIGSPSTFATQWWAWWVELNPDRRDMVVAGRLTPGGRVSFDSVKKPGKNGFLSVLACLMWWRDAIGSGDVTDWENAMREVYWVMLEIRGINTRKRLRSNGDGEDQTNKKARVE